MYDMSGHTEINLKLHCYGPDLRALLDAVKEKMDRLSKTSGEYESLSNFYDTLQPYSIYCN